VLRGPAKHRRFVLSLLVALAVAALLSGLQSGCEDPPATQAELDAMSAIQRVHGHVLTGEGGHATFVDFSHVGTVRDAELAPLADLPYLVRVKFDATFIGNDGLAPLANLQHLRELSLRQSKITDAGLLHLQKLPSLTELDLERLPITDTGLAALGPIKSLRKVYISSSGPTSAGIDALKAQNPKVNVSRK
jgi:Leucine-rich repeat (LRR) protein